MVPAIDQPQMDDDAAALAPKVFGILIECLEIVPGIWQMPLGTSRPGGTHICLTSMKVRSKMSIPGLVPTAKPDTSPLLKAKPVEPVSNYPCI
jgi:hypothetical protein